MRLQRRHPDVDARAAPRPGQAGRAAERRTRTRTALHPSTQAIGSSSVCCGSASRSASDNRTVAVAMHHHEPEGRVGRGARDAGAAGRLVDRDVLRAVCRRGPRRSTRVRSQGTVPAGDRQHGEARRHPGRCGPVLDGSARSPGCSPSCDRAESERRPDHRQLDRDVEYEGTDRYPSHGVVRGAERERPRVPLGGVREPGGELEDRRAHEQRDRSTLEQVQRDRASRRMGTSAKSFGKTEQSLTRSSGTAAVPDRYVHALGDPVEPDRPGRDRQPGRLVLVEVAAITPVTNATVKQMPSQIPIRAATSGLRRVEVKSRSCGIVRRRHVSP